MAFSGFTPQTFTFLGDLAANNNKAWFDANRDRYEAYYKSVALDFIEAARPAVEALTPRLKAEARLNGSLRRINRDVRFSPDKSPYKPRIHIIFWSGDHPNRSPGFHFVIYPDGIGFGAGVFGLQPAQLKGYRTRICDPADRAALVEAAQLARGVGCEWTEPDLKTLPRGFNAEGDWEHLLRRKAFVMRTLERVERPGWIGGAGATDGLMGLITACLPLIRWLGK